MTIYPPVTLILWRPNYESDVDYESENELDISFVDDDSIESEGLSFYHHISTLATNFHLKYIFIDILMS